MKKKSTINQRYELSFPNSLIKFLAVPFLVHLFKRMFGSIICKYHEDSLKASCNPLNTANNLVAIALNDDT